MDDVTDALYRVADQTRRLEAAQAAGDLHPFATLESLYEHLGACWHALGHRQVRDTQRDWPQRSPEYHLAAMDQAACTLLQQLILLLPSEYARTEDE